MTVSQAVFGDEPIRDPAVLAAMYEVLEHCDLTAEDLAGGALRVADRQRALHARTARRGGRSRRAASRSTTRASPLPRTPVPAPIGGRWLLAAGAGRKRLRIGAGRVAGAQRRDDLGRREVPLGEQHERVVQQVGGLAGQGLPGRAPVRGRRASAVASSLAARRTSVASSVTLRATASTPPSSRRAVYEPAGRVATRSAIVAQSVSSQAKPCARHGGRRAVEVEAAPRAAVAGRAGRLDRGEEGVAVAVERERTDESVLPLVSPLRQRRSRDREWKWTLAGRERRRQRLGVDVGEHQDAAVGDVLDDDRDEAVGAEGAARWARLPPSRGRLLGDRPDRQAGGGHRGLDRADRVLARGGRSRPPGPRRRRRRARPRRSPPVPAAPPDATTGTSTRSTIARSSSVSKPARSRRDRSR